ncbi:COG5377 Phage-related protein, predicted endonuclease [uncultured Caudovirales phage]|uniref:COG5377 Phage-related protein, predicted endonuclease n=1 Tax=uncultured Caudovirales phage TaxID=2100421 RepID=A0A6J5MT06_9CAUD|nr:COG5377 Phage-related protein, predicted endonuclease [uncultured Caudovirales phage]
MNITEKIEALGFGKYLGTFEPNSPEWHQARQGIGGSDIGALMDKSPFKSAFQLWAEKTGQLSDDIEPSMPMKLGTAFEPAIRQLFQDENKDWLTVHETGTWQSVANPILKANPDGIIEWKDGELGVLEIKFTRQYWDELPEHYNLQVQHYLQVLGLKRGLVIAVAGGDWKEFDVVWDDSLTRDMKRRVEAFSDLVEAKEPPSYDGSDSTYETVRELSEGLEDGEIELGAMWSNLVSTKSEADYWANALQAQKSAVLAFMNGIKYGLYQGEKVIALQARNGKPFITFK